MLALMRREIQTGVQSRHWILPVPLQINGVGDRCQTFKNVAYCIKRGSYNQLAYPVNIDKIKTKIIPDPTEVKTSWKSISNNDNPKRFPLFIKMLRSTEH